VKSTLVAALIFAPMTALAQAQCALQKDVEAIVVRSLPAFSMSKPARDDPDKCSIVVSGDFNGDGASDYAAVLTEKVAPRTYKDGNPWLISYVVVLLRSELPYAQHQAIVLLGHDATNRLSLKVLAAAAKGKPDQLEIVHQRYGRTVYEWTPVGFVTKEHVAD
jgi:hypothetical protein